MKAILLAILLISFTTLASEKGFVQVDEPELVLQELASLLQQATANNESKE